MLASRLACFIVLVSAGCGTQRLESTPPGPTSPAHKPAPSDDPEHAKKGGIWAECYASFTPTGEPKTDLERMTRACGPTGGMRAITPVKIAEQADKDPADRYTFYVPAAGACYRIYATGDRKIADLDLLLRGPDGEDLQADVTHDSYPVLPPHGPLCFEVPGLYLLEVSVFRGAGRYALQVWGNPSGLGKTSAAGTAVKKP